MGGCDRVGQRFQPEFGSPCVDMFRIFDWRPWTELTGCIPTDMGAIALGAALEVSDSVLKVCQSPGVGVTVLDSDAIQLTGSTNECRVGDVMLSDEERGFTTFFAHQLVAGPASDLIEDCFKAIAVAAVNGPHFGVVARRQFACIKQALANRKVFAG